MQTCQVFNSDRCVTRLSFDEKSLVVVGKDGLRQCTVSSSSEPTDFKFSEPITTSSATFDGVLTDVAFSHPNVSSACPSFYITSCHDGQATVFSEHSKSLHPIAKFMAPCVAVDANENNYVLAASQDGKIKLQHVHFDSSTNKFSCDAKKSIEFASDSDGVICAKFVQKDLIGVCGCHGKFSLWQVKFPIDSNPDGKLQVSLVGQTFGILPKIKGSELDFQRLVFATLPDGLLALPSQNSVCLVRFKPGSEARKALQTAQKLDAIQRHNICHVAVIPCRSCPVATFFLAIGDVRGGVSLLRMQQKGQDSFEIETILDNKQFAAENASIGSIALQLGSTPSNPWEALGTQIEAKTDESGPGVTLYVSDCLGQLHCEFVDATVAKPVKKEDSEDDDSDIDIDIDEGVEETNFDDLDDLDDLDDVDQLDETKNKIKRLVVKTPHKGEKTNDNKKEDEAAEIAEIAEIADVPMIDVIDVKNVKNVENEEKIGAGKSVSLDLFAEKSASDASLGSKKSIFDKNKVVGSTGSKASKGSKKGAMEAKGSKGSKGSKGFHLSKFAVTESVEEEKDDLELLDAVGDDPDYIKMLEDEDNDLIGREKEFQMDGKHKEALDIEIDGLGAEDEDDLGGMDALDGLDGSEDDIDIGADDGPFGSGRKKKMQPNGVMSNQNVFYSGHAPFQTNSTEWDHSGQRYLTWNEIGAVIARKTQNTSSANSNSNTSHSGAETASLLKSLNAQQNDVQQEQYWYEVDFSDKSIYSRAIRFTDTRHYQQAALSSTGLLLASNVEDSHPVDALTVNTVASVVSYRPFNSWGYTSLGRIGWSFNLTNSEKCVCVGLTPQYVIVATNKGFIRIFTRSGLQCNIFCIAGQAVNISGNLKSVSNRANTNVVAITYDTGRMYALEMVVLDLSARKTLYSGSVCLTPFCFPTTCKLRWVYVSNNGKMVVCMDSEHMIRVLAPKMNSFSFDSSADSFGSAGAVGSQWSWIPVADIRSVILKQQQQDDPNVKLNINKDHLDVNMQNFGNIDEFECFPLFMDWSELSQSLQVTAVILPVYESSAGKGVHSIDTLKFANTSMISIEIPLLASAATGLNGQDIALSGFEADIMKKELLYQVDAQGHNMQDRDGKRLKMEHKKDEVKSYIKLFQKACELNKVVVAYDIACVYLKDSLKAVNSCLKIAIHMKMTDLADKINKFLARQMNENNASGGIKHTFVGKNANGRMLRQSKESIKIGKSMGNVGSASSAGSKAFMTAANNNNNKNCVIGKKRSLKSAGLGNNEETGSGTGKHVMRSENKGMIANRSGGPPPAAKRRINPFSKGK